MAHSLTDLPLRDLEDRLEEAGIERWRARPMLLWLYRRGAESFDAMTDLSLGMRERLPKLFRTGRTRVKHRHPAPDGTTKFLLELDGGEVIETVLIPDGDRRTVCISTQVGCPVGCVFCASGLNGLDRNLSTGEIVEQVLHVRRALPEEERISNVVIMGIGEPLLNMEALVPALKIMKASWGLGIGYNRITLSTVGVLGRLEELVERRVTPNLALSLHAPSDRIRAEVVPSMKNVRLAQIIKAGLEYKRATRKEVTFEYVLLEGINDDRKHALELGKKLKGHKVKVNVIPFNRVEELPYRAPTPERVTRFVEALGGCGVPVTVRRRKGDAVSAACGQLRATWTRERTCTS